MEGRVKEVKERVTTHFWVLIMVYAICRVSENDVLCMV